MWKLGHFGTFRSSIEQLLPVMPMWQLWTTLGRMSRFGPFGLLGYLVAFGFPGHLEPLSATMATLAQ